MPIAAIENRPTSRLAVPSADHLLFGIAPRPVLCGRGLAIGAGTVLPEINFTLPEMEITPGTWPEVRRQYETMARAVCSRAAELAAPGLLMELETLPPMTLDPALGLEILRLLADILDEWHSREKIPCALRFTPNDMREIQRPPRMRSGPSWNAMQEAFHRAGESGADLLAIESTGGKEICDRALMEADIGGVVFALGVLAPRDMRFLWSEIVSACRGTGILPSGDTACGFANTAMALAEQRMLPRVFAAVVRVAAVPRGLVPFQVGAVGPNKDCGYEGPYLKAIAGVPISMEGSAAACAHLSSIGNAARAVCDCWSNESVQNVRLLSAMAPVVSVEQLIYDCRLLNRAAARSKEDARRLRDCLAESDAALDPQAFVLRPDVVLRIAERIVREPTPYLQTRAAVREAIAEIRSAHRSGETRVPKNELRWLDRLEKQADCLPDSEDGFCDQMRDWLEPDSFLPGEYGLPQ